MAKTFDKKLVKAVAERLWWKRTEKSELGEMFDLTESQIDELRATPEYRSTVLNLMVGQRSRKAFETWVRRHPEQRMPERFGSHMGLDTEVVPAMVKQARRYYDAIASGKAEAPEVILNPYKERVDVSQARIIGSGGESVYLYYFPTYQRYAEVLGEPQWPCNIGRTKNVVTDRVSQQIGDQLPEKPQIALILRTENCQRLETHIHNVLKSRQIEDAIGKEWFLTDPSEVEAIYQRSVVVE